jgi:hypothetical protein
VARIDRDDSWYNSSAAYCVHTMSLNTTRPSTIFY